MSVNWTLTDLKAIEEAIAQGVREVEYNDRTVKYMSLKEMQQVRELIKRSLGLNKRGGRILCASSKGTV